MTTSETIDLTPTTLVTPQLFSILNDNTVATTSNRVQDIRGVLGYRLSELLKK